MPFGSVQSLIGLFVLVGVAWALSEDKRSVNWRFAAAGIGLQILLALLFLRVPAMSNAMASLNALARALEAASRAGTTLVFGYVGGGPTPFEVSAPSQLFIIGFQALPMVIFMSALSALLWHLKVLRWITTGFAWALQRTLTIGGAVGLSAAANVFMGMVEAPLMIRAYLIKLSRAELFIVMTTGLATIAGSVLIIYSIILADTQPGALGHLITASIISLPAAVVMARLMVPGDAVTDASDIDTTIKYRGSLDAVMKGTADGLQLFLIIAATLIVMTALVALTNSLLVLLPDVAGAAISAERIFGWIFAPLVWLFGVPWSEAMDAGALMGTKTILNEFLAYLNLAALPEGTLSPRSTLIMMYALCGFANLGSVGIMVSGLSTMVPSRRDEIVDLGVKSLIAGTLATSMTGAVVGLLTWT
jgi:concentrative nucleoside transporter, CNT family